MTQNHQRITIIGTGCIGASIGMALRQSADAEHLEIVGHDREMRLARQAQKLAAFDRIEFNLHRALDGAPLVILAVPLAALREVLGDLGRLLDAHAGTVVTDTAPQNAPAIAWADELLPPGNYFVSGDPFLAPGVGGWEPLAGRDAARADLFARATYAITPRAADHPSAVQSVINLALTLGAEPLLMQPAEHDAARIIADTVPSLVAAALFHATATAPGWVEVRKAAGRPFATATAGVVHDAPSQRMQALLGRATTLRGLDAVIAQLNILRQTLHDGNAESLENTFATVAQARAYWMTESQNRTWDIERGSIAQESLFQRSLQILVGEAVMGKKP